MQIFIVSRGEIGQGGSIVSVSTTEEEALIEVKKIRACFAGGWRPNGKLQWRNGCDFKKIDIFDLPIENEIKSANGKKIELWDFKPYNQKLIARLQPAIQNLRCANMSYDDLQKLVDELKQQILNLFELPLRGE